MVIASGVLTYQHQRECNAYDEEKRCQYSAEAEAPCSSQWSILEGLLRIKWYPNPEDALSSIVCLGYRNDIPCMRSAYVLGGINVNLLRR